ncbi:neuropeptide CCHamide-1 receptor-like [Periplaneta americana]|uniref:neuropeptide CCHamide-1 receptor-like n=1 Tax=Periplaneta americana TaxID=6978 RepID=UPI0037E85B2D
MITLNVQFISVLIVLTLNLQETWSQSNDATYNSTNVTTSEEGEGIIKIHVSGHPTTECFRTVTEANDMTASTVANYYGNFVSSESCLEQESNRLKKQGKRFDRVPKYLVSIAFEFVQFHNDSAGQTFLVEMRSFVEELETLIKQFNAFNKILNNNGTTTYNLSVDGNRYEISLRNYRNILTMFEQLYSTILQYYTTLTNSRLAKNLTEQYNLLQDLSSLEDAYEQIVISGRSTEELLQQVRKLVEFRANSGLNNTFNTNFTRQLLDLEYWENHVTEQKNTKSKFEKYLRNEKFRVPLQHYLQPTVHAVIFIIGFVGNVVVIIIIIRHRDIRLTANMLLLNLAVGDLLNLVLNIPVFHTYFTSTSWQLGEATCKMFRFFRQLGISASIYSVVVLTIQRYVVLTRLNTIQNNSIFGQHMATNLKILLTVSLAWLIGLVIAIPHTAFAGIYENNCFSFSKAVHIHYSKGITVFDILIVCIVPLSLIGIFSTLSSRILENSVKNMTTESKGTEKCVKAQIVSSRILRAITIVSAISYVPLYFYLFAEAWFGIQIDARVNYFIFFLTYSLLFANSCFNPIALCVACERFRCGFKRYLLCRKNEVLNANQVQITPSSGSTSLETKI